MSAFPALLLKPDGTVFGFWQSECGRSFESVTASGSAAASDDVDTRIVRRQAVRVDRLERNDARETFM